MDFSFGDFGTEVGAINPAALPPNKRRRLTIYKLLRNLFIVAYIVGFCALYYWLFGKENVLIGATLATCSLKMRQAVLGIKVPQAGVCILFCYLLVALGPLIGNVNLFLAIPVNFFFLFMIATLTGQHVLQKTEYYFLAAYIFAESAPATSAGVFWIRFAALMAGGLYIAVLYCVFHRKEKRQRTIVQVFRNLHLTSTRNRFALRIAGGLMIAMLIGDIFHMHYAVWIGMPVLSLSMPFVQDSFRRAIYRLIGNLIGGLFFLTIFHYVIPDFLHVWFLLALLYLYLFLTDYRLQQMVISIFSLNGAMVFYGTGVAIEMRIFLLLIGIAIVMAMNLLEYVDLIDRLDSLIHRRRYLGPHPDADDDELPLEHKIIDPNGKASAAKTKKTEKVSPKK